nr:hypothetical protein [Tanacetum cinerariifolium]
MRTNPLPRQGEGIYTPKGGGRPRWVWSSPFLPWAILAHLLSYGLSALILWNDRYFTCILQKFLNNLQPEWSRHVTIVHQTKDLHTADYTHLYDFLKYNQKEVDELKAERLAKIQDPLALMANSNNLYASPAPHQDQSPFNQNFLQQPITNPEDITDLTTAMNMALSLMAKAFKLNYSTPTNNNQRISSNPRNRQIAQPVQNFRNQVAQNPRVQNDGIQNQNGNGHFARDCTVMPRRMDAAYLQTQLLIAQKEEAGIQLQAEEY